MKAVTGPAIAASADERQHLIGELFHALSQPLTALRCSLELALRDPAVAPPHQNLETALGHAEQIAQLTTGIRNLLAANDPGDNPVALALAPLLQEAVDDLLPVAESLQVTLTLEPGISGSILAEPRRLHQAFFYLLEYALLSAAADSNLFIEAGQENTAIAITLTGARKPSCAADLRVAPINSKQERANELGRRLGLAIAGRIFEVAGGKLQVQEDEHHVRLRVRLPLA